MIKSLNNNFPPDYLAKRIVSATRTSSGGHEVKMEISDRYSPSMYDVICHPGAHRCPNLSSSFVPPNYPGETNLVEEYAVAVIGSGVLGRAIALLSTAANRDRLSMEPQR
jgi:hypothetical protein